MRTNRLNVWMSTSMIAGLLASAGAAFARPAAQCSLTACPPGDESEGRQNVLVPLTATTTTFGEPEVITIGEPMSTTSSSRVMVSITDGHEVKVVDKDGEVTVTVDGEKVDASRVKRENGWLTVTDGEGKVIAKMMMDDERAPRAARKTVEIRGQAHGEAPHAPGQARIIVNGKELGVGGPGGENALAGKALTIDAGPPPKVMLGITTAAASADLLAHLGVSDGTGLMVGSIVPDSPASAAGLAQGDLIVKIDGESLDDALSLRSHLKDKNPGDEVKLTVYHRGAAKDITVKLAPYDNQKFSTIAPITRVAPDEDMIEVWKERLGQDDGANRALAERLAELSRDLGNLKDANQAQAKALRDRALALAEEARAKRNPMVIPEPPVLRDVPLMIERRGMNADTDERLRKLESQMDRIEQMLKELAARQGNP